MYRRAAIALAVVAGAVAVTEAQQTTASVVGTKWAYVDQPNKTVSFNANGTYTVAVRYPNETRTYKGSHTWLQAGDTVEMTLRDTEIQVYSVGQINGSTMTVTGTTSYTAGGRPSTRFKYTLQKQ